MYAKDSSFFFVQNSPLKWIVQFLELWKQTNLLSVRGSENWCRALLRLESKAIRCQKYFRKGAKQTGINSNYWDTPRCLDKWRVQISWWIICREWLYLHWLCYQCIRLYRIVPSIQMKTGMFWYLNPGQFHWLKDLTNLRSQICEILTRVVNIWTWPDLCWFLVDP